MKNSLIAGFALVVLCGTINFRDVSAQNELITSNDTNTPEKKLSVVVTPMKDKVDSYRITFLNPEERNNVIVKIFDEDGNVLHSEWHSGVSVHTKRYSLSEMPKGMYKVVVSNKFDSYEQSLVKQ